MSPPQRHRIWQVIALRWHQERRPDGDSNRVINLICSHKIVGLNRIQAKVVLQKIAPPLYMDIVKESSFPCVNFNYSSLKSSVAKFGSTLRGI